MIALPTDLDIKNIFNREGFMRRWCLDNHSRKRIIAQGLLMIQAHRIIDHKLFRILRKLGLASVNHKTTRKGREFLYQSFTHDGYQ